MKDITFKDEARQKLVQGVEKLTDAVKVTMGPRGRNVLIQRGIQKPFITKDGVTVAQEIFLKDPVQNMAAQLVKEVSGNVAYEAGDGTTTATVLTNSIFKEGMKYVIAGAHPVALKKSIDESVKEIISELKKNSKEITNEIEVQQIATISANGDEDIGEMISNAIKEVGVDGSVTVDEGTGTSDVLEIVDGMKIDRGYISSHFINNKEKGNCEIINPYVLSMDSKISNLGEILHILEQVQQEKRPLVIFCDDVDSEPLSTIIVNKLRGIIDLYPVKAPGFGEGKENTLLDIAVSTGGEFISKDGAYPLISIGLSELGEAEKIIIDKDSTVIIGGKGSEEKIKEHVALIKKQIEQTDPGHKQDKLKERVSKFSGGVAVIKVGAMTEVEMIERRDRIEDAIGSTKAAIEEGIVIGGGCALAHASKILKEEFSGKENDMGISIIKKAILAPLHCISENSGLNSGIVENTVIGYDDVNIGFNARTETYENLFDSGVIDPLKVTRLALENAASVAGMLLTTECTINETKED